MSSNASQNILICGKSLFLCALASQLTVMMGSKVRVTRQTAPSPKVDFVPDVVVMEQDQNVPTAIPSAALRVLTESTGGSVILLNPANSMLTVLSSHTTPVDNLSDVLAKIVNA